jgi:Na+-driven multidrug efflux pump
MTKNLLWSLGVVVGLAITLLFARTVGAWLSDRSDALWWQLLPWLLLIGLWTYIVILIRKRQGPWGQDRTQ